MSYERVWRELASFSVSTPGKAGDRLNHSELSGYLLQNSICIVSDGLCSPSHG